jgi:hypothetical protein
MAEFVMVVTSSTEFLDYVYLPLKLSTYNIKLVKLFKRLKALYTVQYCYRTLCICGPIVTQCCRRHCVTYRANTLNCTLHNVLDVLHCYAVGYKSIMLH